MVLILSRDAVAATIAQPAQRPVVQWWVAFSSMPSTVAISA
jgi:hypothetical protein